MPRTAHSSAPLFRSVAPLEASEKVAFFDSGMASSLGKVPDDAEKWPAHALSRAHKEMPYLSEFDVSVVMERTDPEAGYGMGYLMIRNRSAQNKPQSEIARPQNYVRVPVIIKERDLLPFKVFELGGRIYPLNKARIRRALVNTSIFDGVGSAPRHSKNLTFDHRPPYQQRQGFGKIYDATAGQAGLGKISSAPLTAKEHVAQALEEFAEKKAYGFRPPSDSNNPWVEKFAGTPFYDEAKDLCADGAQRRLEDAQREAVRSAKFAAEAHLRVEGATLEAKLAAFKADTEDVPEEDTLRKLSSARMGEAGCPWDMMFEGTPFYSDALHYCAKEAQLRAQDNMDWDNASWRETEREKRMLDAKLAAWKYEQETGREFTGLQANVNITLTEGGEQPGPIKAASATKIARIFGASVPRELSEPALSYDRRQRSLANYIAEKRKEEPTPLGTALLTGGGIGAGLGALSGLAGGGSVQSGLAGAAIGGLGGMGLGALMQMSDQEKIRRAQEIHGNRKAIADELDRNILSQVRSREFRKHLDRERRHGQLLDAIHERSRAAYPWY